MEKEIGRCRLSTGFIQVHTKKSTRMNALSGEGNLAALIAQIVCMLYGFAQSGEFEISSEAKLPRTLPEAGY
eukprot:scaffold2488_cov23-Tisochrysis_lutea.AAC.1